MVILRMEEMFLEMSSQNVLTPGHSQTIWKKVPVASEEHNWHAGDDFLFIWWYTAYE